MSPFLGTISEYVWEKKYRYQLGQVVYDQTIEDTWHRVAKAVARIEAKERRTSIYNQFYDMLADFKFLPGGRILAGAGTQHSVTLFNCFVMPILEDSLQGIFDALKEAALTLQQGGGVGYDFSILRPSGSHIVQTGSYASGPISFMRIWDAMCATLQSTGARRGAMMGILRCDHPDIEEFISIKSKAEQLQHFNLSVLVSDAFMQAVAQDQEWSLIFPYDEIEPDAEMMLQRWSGRRSPVPCRVVKKISARVLWEKIMRSAYDCAEPGVLFEDTINSHNNLWYREWITATNPCGEIPLPDYGACNLGSINLTQFIRDPFTERVSLDWKKLESVTTTAVRFLDNVIEVSRYPLRMQKQEALATRRIGLGLTGLGDLFVMMGIPYGSPASLALASQIMKRIADTTWVSSIELAAERGSFPLFHSEKYVQGQFVQGLSEAIRRDIERYGIRNSHHNAIAPAGTISLLANNVSNGIEPIFGADYQRSVRGTGGELHSFQVTDYAAHLWRKTSHAHDLPPAWADSQSLLPGDHLRIQASLQPFVDHAISKTINLPEDFPFEDLASVYTEAYQFGLKGCTIYRPNPIRAGILRVSSATDEVDHCCQDSV